MITFIGHGVMKKYSRVVEYIAPIPLELYVRACDMPDSLYENLIAVKEPKVLSLDYIVSDGDIIHLFLALMGG